MAKNSAPKSTMIYLAGPMDDVDVAVADGWRQKLADEYPAVLFFLPNRAYRNASRANFSKIVHMNCHAISCSHGMLANLDGPGRGFGTIREIEFARSQGRAVAVVADPEEIGIHTMFAYDIFLHEDIHSAMEDLLTQINEARDTPVHPLAGLFGGGGGMIELRPQDEEEDDESA